MKVSKQLSEISSISKRVSEMEKQLLRLCGFILEEFPNSDCRWDYAKIIYDRLIDESES